MGDTKWFVVVIAGIIIVTGAVLFVGLQAPEPPVDATPPAPEARAGPDSELARSVERGVVDVNLLYAGGVLSPAAFSVASGALVHFHVASPDAEARVLIPAAGVDAVALPGVNADASFRAPAPGEYPVRVGSSTATMTVQ